MTTISLKNFLLDKFPLKKTHDTCIYVIRDGKTIFYVGKSNRDVIERVKSHFGLGDMFPSYFDQLRTLMMDNAPQSGKWKVDLYTIADCSKKLECEFRDTEEAEPAMILTLCPCLNATYNRNRSGIPEKYTKKETERKIAMAKKMAKMFDE